MKSKLEDLKENLSEKIDVFLCSSSFEDRCLALPSAVSQFGIPSILVFYFEDFDKKIIENSKKLLAVLGENARRIPIQIGSPTATLLAMSNALNEIRSQDKPQNYYIDITTFTHEGLLILFKLIQLKIKDSDRVFISYNGAKDYSYNEKDPDKKWLSKGVKSIRSILGYPGLTDPSKKNHLIILFGFERERTKRLVDIFEYDLVSFAFGSKDASITDHHQKLNERRHEELLSYYPNAIKFEISLIDPLQSRDQVLKYLEGYPEYNTVIAPMNNKISTIGAGLAEIEKPEIQLCYMSANQYNSEAYSIAGDEGYFFEIFFKST